jgi:hypothetical protein
MSGIRWTRLAEEPIWAEGARAHRRRFGRVYHDWDRVLRLYDRAGTLLDLPYDRALDLAILAHSAQIDLGGNRRARSVAWLRSHAGPDEPIEAAGSLILKGPYQDLNDPRLPLLELSDLGEPENAERAVAEMIEQVRLLTRFDQNERTQAPSKPLYWWGSPQGCPLSPGVTAPGHTP